MAGRLFAGCWLAALALHVAWVPNLVWFMVVPRASRPERALLIIPVTVPPRPEAPPREGEAEAAGRRLPEIQLPGVAAGGSSRALALRRHEWTQAALVQQRSHAQRALDRAEQPLSYRPAVAGRSTSPAERVSLPRVDDDDLRLDGARTRDRSLLRRRGERLDGEARREPGEGGVSSPGLTEPAEGGELALASAGRGGGQDPGVARLGARPRVASPAVTVAEASSDALRDGPLAGLTPSRQATPVTATSEPVREARRASGAASRTDVLDGGEVARRGGQGASREARGPGQGGRGQGVAGAGRASNPLLDDYIRDTQARVNRYWGYPPDLEFALVQELVILGVTVRYDGHVEAVTVQRSSGYPAFDAWAIRAVQRANPLGPPPPEALFRSGRNSMLVTLRMRYRNPMFE